MKTSLIVRVVVKLPDGRDLIAQPLSPLTIDTNAEPWPEKWVINHDLPYGTSLIINN